MNPSQSKSESHNRLKLNNSIPTAGHIAASISKTLIHPSNQIKSTKRRRRRSDLILTETEMRINGVETAMIQRPVRPPAPTREDYWNEEATSTLIEAWGDHHMKLNRGNLRRKHWQEVADTVNAHHGTTKRSRRTDVQCKNRIDTLKKKYKSEKSKIWSSGDETLTSNWPFYHRLDSLVGTPSSSSSKRRKKKNYMDDQVGRRSVRTNYFRAAAEAAKTDSEASSRKKKKKNGDEDEDEDEDVDGVKELARAIGKLGEIYERVEETKQRQFIELEKQRMEYMKSLEFEKMQFYMDTQIQLEKFKRSKRAGGGNDCFLSLSMREKA